MGYLLNTGSSDWKQIDGSTAITVTSTKVDSGTAKGLGSDRDVLNNSGLSLDDNQLYGSQIVAGADPDVTGSNLSLLGNQIAGNYSIRKILSDIVGVQTDKIASGASDFGYKKINKRNSEHTTKTATAVRSGYWNIFTGTFSTLPSHTEDVAAESVLSIDDETLDSATGRGVLGEFVYRDGTNLVVKQADYPASKG